MSGSENHPWGDRLKKKIASVLSIILFSCGLTFLVASPASAHAIVCTYTPNTPTKSGTRVSYSASASCNFSPDASATSIRLWRHDGGGAYTLMSYIDSPATTPAYRYWSAQIGCGTTLSRQYHTQIVNESFHHNWGRVDKNSASVWLTC